jgi:photosystem II stability/assembly factor-like uncharacterized protein
VGLRNKIKMSNLEKGGVCICTRIAALMTMSCGVNFAAEWKAVNTGLTNMEVRSVAIDPARSTSLYAGTQNGLFKSLDGGASWRPSGLPDRATTHLVIDFVNPSILYAATQITRTGYFCYERVLFKSTDGGATWSDSVTPPDQGCDTIRVLLLDPTDANTLVYAAYLLIMGSTS